MHAGKDKLLSIIIIVIYLMKNRRIANIGTMYIILLSFNRIYNYRIYNNSNNYIYTHGVYIYRELPFDASSDGSAGMRHESGKLTSLQLLGISL